MALAKNDKILLLADDTYGLILDEGKLLVVENNYVATLGKVPEDKYFVHPKDLQRLPFETKIIFHSNMISRGMDSPFPSDMKRPVSGNIR